MEILSPRRQSLTIEARHTISLQVAKQRRLKVASSLFLPSKPVRQIIPISCEHEKEIANPEIKPKKTKKEEESLIEPKQTEKKKRSPRKQTSSTCKESQRKKRIPSKLILFLTGEEIDKLALPKQPRPTRSAKEKPSSSKETVSLSSEVAKGEEDKSPSSKGIVSATKKGKDRTHCSRKAGPSNDKCRLSEISKSLTQSTTSNSSKERRSSSLKPVLSPSSESEKGSSSPKQILSSSPKTKDREGKTSPSDSEREETDVGKEIAPSSRKEKDKTRRSRKEEASNDKCNLSEITKALTSLERRKSPCELVLSASSASQKEKEDITLLLKQILSPSPRIEERERKNSPTNSEKGETDISEEILPASGKEEESETHCRDKEETSEEYNLAQILSERISSSPKQVEIEAELLPTTTDRSVEKFEIQSTTTIDESKKRSPRKQILFRTRNAELEKSHLFKKIITETLLNPRGTNEQMETVAAVEEMTISDKVTPVAFYPECVPAANSSTNADSDVYILTTDPNGSKQFEVPKPHNTPSVITPVYENFVQYQGLERPQATSLHMPANMFQSVTDKRCVGYERSRLLNTKNRFVQKSSTNHRKCTSEEHTVCHRSRDTSDKVEYITRYYNDKPIDYGLAQAESCSNLCRHNEVYYQPYDLSQRRPREYLQPLRSPPELPSPAYHNQQQFNQGPVHSGSVQPNFIAEWVSALNAQNQIVLANTVIQPTQEMPSTSHPPNLPQWLQQSINNLKVNAPAINIPAPVVQSASHQAAAFREHPTPVDMGRWVHPPVTQGPFEPMNSHPSMQQWPNSCPSYQKFNSHCGNPSLMHHEPEIPSMGYPHIIQAGNPWYPVPMTSPPGNRDRSAFGAPNLQPHIRHEEAPITRQPYSGHSVIYQADSTTGGNSPPIQSGSIPRPFIEPLNHYPSRPAFYKPEAHRSPQLPYSRINNYPSFGHGHGHGPLNNVPEYDPRRNR